MQYTTVRRVGVAALITLASACGGGGHHVSATRRLQIAPGTTSDSSTTSSLAAARQTPSNVKSTKSTKSTTTTPTSDHVPIPASSPNPTWSGPLATTPPVPTPPPTTSPTAGPPPTSPRPPTTGPPHTSPPTTAPATRCSDNSSLSHRWLTGNPNTGLAGGAHFYLTLVACSTHISGTVTLTGVVNGTPTTTGGDWQLEFRLGTTSTVLVDHHLPGPATITYNTAVVGQEYRFRVENLMTGVTVTASASFTS